MSEETRTNSVAANSEETGGLPEHLKPYQFKPGQSGNPNGRPKRKWLTEIYEELLEDPEKREAIKQAAYQRLVSGRMVGAIEFKEAAERVEGKVSTPIEVEGDLAILTLAERMAKARDRAGS